MLIILLAPYLVLMLKMFSVLKRIKVFQPVKISGIFVSVVVACRNEELNLPGLLSDIAGQTYDNDCFELIIADDNSTDLTFKIASEFKGIRNLKVLKSNGSGKKRALKTAIGASKGSVIITTDADCRVGKQWISAIVSYYSGQKPHMIIGPVIPECAAGFTGRFCELEFLGLQAVTAATAAAGSPVMCNGANLAFTKDVYYRHCDNIHFDLNTGDDIFLLHSLKAEKDSRIAWLESPEAAVKSKLPDRIIPFLDQRARWISKAGHYKDSQTIMLAIVILTATILLAGLFISAIIYISVLPVLLAAFAIKSIPDYLLLSNTSTRYGMKKAMRWFLPSLILYPFYVLAVIFSLPAGTARH